MLEKAKWPLIKRIYLCQTEPPLNNDALKSIMKCHWKSMKNIHFSFSSEDEYYSQNYIAKFYGLKSNVFYKKHLISEYGKYILGKMMPRRRMF